jgi:hypothetical protein
VKIINKWPILDAAERYNVYKAHQEGMQLNDKHETVKTLYPIHHITMYYKKGTKEHEPETPTQLPSTSTQPTYRQYW